MGQIINHDRSMMSQKDLFKGCRITWKLFVAKCFRGVLQEVLVMVFVE